MNKRQFFSIMFGLVALASSAQRQAIPGSPMGGNHDMALDSWQVNINPMDASKRAKITRTVEEMQSRGGATRSVTTDILKAMGFAGVSSAVDVVTTEIIHLAQYRKEQKRKWMQLIENESNYTDSISSIKGLNDFYLQTSRYGALDPSNINFDGISIRGVRNGKEVVYMSCHIDTTKLEHLFQHSKFQLVVDTIAFNPYECHLPNLSANGIRLMGNEQTERDNSFSYDERDNLNIGMELTLSSSWINQAIFVQKDVQLGTFKLNVSIPSGTQLYTYSRKAIENNKLLMHANPSLRLDTTEVQIEGDCFVVPRSYMPISGEEPMWGTGEYNIKVKFRESCQFSQDATHNEKMKHWRKDYKQLRKMQKKGSEFNEYFRTLWNQNGETLMKTMIKQGLNSGVSAAGLSATSGGGAAGGGAGAAGAGAGSGASAGGGMPVGQGNAPQR